MSRRSVHVHFSWLLAVASAWSACGDDSTDGLVPDGGPSFGGDGFSADGSMADGLGGDGAGDGTADGSGGRPDGSAAADGDVSAPTGELPAGDDYGGWTWVETPGSKCRDGSPAGYYYRLGTAKNLMIFLNGGGACADRFFCGLNPVNVEQDMPLQFLIEGTGNLVFGPNPFRQLPPEEGIFKRDPKNPVGEWSMVFVPYCTGDIHSGVNEDVIVPDVPGTQQFVGYTNFGLFLDSFGPAFASADQVLLTGSSAGGFGTLLNFDRTQQFFDKYGATVTAITDSGVPMRDEFMAPCLQKRWRELWGLDKLPMIVECGAACQRSDGGGLTEGLGEYMFRQKYAGRVLGGAVSTKEDEIIRAFFAPGLSATEGAPDDCTLDPTSNTVFSALYLSGRYPGEKYTRGLKDAAETFGLDQLGYYGWDGSAHMHLWRPDYYVNNGTEMVLADWVAEILAGKTTKVGKF